MTLLSLRREILTTVCKLTYDHLREYQQVTHTYGACVTDVGFRLIYDVLLAALESAPVPGAMSPTLKEFLNSEPASTATATVSTSFTSSVAGCSALSRGGPSGALASSNPPLALSSSSHTHTSVARSSSSHGAASGAPPALEHTAGLAGCLTPASSSRQPPTPQTSDTAFATPGPPLSVASATAAQVLTDADADADASSVPPSDSADESATRKKKPLSSPLSLESLPEDTYISDGQYPCQGIHSQFLNE